MTIDYEDFLNLTKMDPKHLTPGDATLIENIVSYLKANGIFDEFRHECLADVDTKSSFQNLSQRVDGQTSKYLANETWHSDLNKNELRNKLRQHILQSSFLAPGTDIVVEQVITAKLYNYFLPKIIEVVHRYVKEQSELLNKKPEPTTSSKSSLTSEKTVSDTAENKDKILKSDPIAEILCFLHPKTESVQHKDGDVPKVEKVKEEKNIPPVSAEAIITPVNEAKIQPKKDKDKIKKEDSKIQQESLKKVLDIQGETITTSATEAKVSFEKEKDKIKKEDPKIQQEVLKKTVKDEIKSEKKKIDDVKVSVSEIATTSEKSSSSVPVSLKSNVSSKKDDKNKLKSKSQNIQKSSSNASEVKRSKKDSSEKSSDKLNKSKFSKSPKESHSPTKVSNSQKSVFKEDKGECSKTKSHDTGNNKTSESLVKKSKSSCDKKDTFSSKYKACSEKTDKPKVSKSVDKSEPHIHPDSSNSEKGSKSIQYSSSYDSSQGSDQEKNTSTNSETERPKHFRKHANKEKSGHSDNNNKTDKKRSNSEDESPSKKIKNEKDTKLKLKDISVIEAAKICSRSNSFGSTSSIGSSSNASKDNLISNSDETSENSVKDKKKKQVKEKDSCHSSPKTLPPPPPPPPPPSSSLTSELTSSAEMSSSVEDTQSSANDSETSSHEDISEESSSDSELESKDLINYTLNENALNSSNDNINAFYDIFLYSSSSSEFEGYASSPDKKAPENIFETIDESNVSVSSVHTSDLSSYEDELSSDDEIVNLTGGLRKRFTLKEAQEHLAKQAILNEEKKAESESVVDEDLINKSSEKLSSFVLSDDEVPPSEPKRSLRRERKLNPRYSSSEYTSIYNCKKENFITKQSSPSIRNQILSPKTEPKIKKKDSIKENNKLVKETLKEAKNSELPSDEMIISEKNKNIKKDLQDEDDNSKMSSSDEIESFMAKGKLFKENNKNNLISDNDKLKDDKKLKPYNNSKSRRNSHSLKRKFEVTESTPIKRPCSRSSVDSSSSEFAPNENKPFNSEKNDFHEEKKNNECSLKGSSLTIGVKKDLFCKQRANNNGDILGQKNSHNKVNSEKKTNESDTSRELTSL